MRLGGGYFNPRPPRGGRRITSLTVTIWATFQSTPPARGATAHGVAAVVRFRFQSTPPARGATVQFQLPQPILRFQSTPPARGATRLMMFHEIDGKISIHAPREGGDSMGKAIKIVNTDFNPRPPRGGRPGWITGTAAGLGISIHAPREGGDILYGCTAYFSWYFNPRPPRGGRLLCLIFSVSLL